MFPATLACCNTEGVDISEEMSSERINAFQEPNFDESQSEQRLGLYVHVPFCATTCDFCAFYQEQPKKGDFEQYVDGIERELDLLDRPLPIETVFWGGGTPGLLPPAEIRRLGGILTRAFAAAPVEWTVEMTPGCIREERLDALAEIGVTRVSFGAQSFQPRLLEALGRRYSRRKIFAAYEMLRERGFDNVNIDLMFALPGQTAEDWTLDLAEAVALHPDHLSTYCLTFEDDTALYVKLCEGKVSLDEAKEIAFYTTAWEVLGAAGYTQYEISNYARPGRECIHNINTWSMREWVGLGPAAASQHLGFRSSNPANFRLWLERLREGARSGEERQPLSPELLAADLLVFGLRMNAGVDLKDLRRRFGCEPSASLSSCLEAFAVDELAIFEGSRVRLTPAGRMVVDRMAIEILDTFDR